MLGLRLLRLKTISFVRPLLCGAAMCLAPSFFAQRLFAQTLFTQQSVADVPRIGTLDFFGLTHVQEGRIRQALKAKEGDPLPASKGDAEERIDAISGIVASHLEAVCCDGDKMILYVGVEERGAGHFDIREAPEGDVMLPAEIVSTYRDFLEAVEAATRRGSTAEDLTQGHSLMADPDRKSTRLNSSHT